MLRLVVAGVSALWAVGILACQKPVAEVSAFQPAETKDYNRPLPPGALALRKIDPADYPDFGPGVYHRAGLKRAIDHSLTYLAKPSSRKYYPYGDISHARVVASLRHFKKVLADTTTPTELHARVCADFEVYQSVGCDDAGTVLFTGYYCPIFEARLERAGPFRYPLYRAPPDLVKDAEGEILGRRRPDGTLDSTYPTRREIEEGRLLDGHEIAWLKSAFEAYVVTVQGSAKLRLGNGRLYEIGYAGSNGHPYTPIAEAMIADGVIGRDELSLQTLLDYFAAYPEQTHKYAWKNDRYVFFQEAPGGPFGSLNTPVTPYRTIATDKAVFPRGALSFVNTKVPAPYDGDLVNAPFASFVLDQDTGGAIRAAGRCDIFFGTGSEAQGLAGRTYAEGQLYYVFLKPSIARGLENAP